MRFCGRLAGRNDGPAVGNGGVLDNCSLFRALYRCGKTGFRLGPADGFVGLSGGSVGGGGDALDIHFLFYALHRCGKTPVSDSARRTRCEAEMRLCGRLAGQNGGPAVGNGGAWSCRAERWLCRRVKMP